MPKIPLPAGLVGQYAAGMSVRALAAEYQMAEQTVTRRLREAGIQIRREALSRMPLEEMRRLYEAGLSAKDLARESGLALQTVQRRLRGIGVHIRGPAERTDLHRERLRAARRVPVDESRLRELHAQGMSCRDMAPLLGCHEETVRDRLIELGLPRLPGKARPERNTFWRGGYTVDEQGYILKKEPGHPRCDDSGYVRVHRLVMENQLGRYLRPEEVVDHRNGDTSDNDPGNLRLFASNADHLRATLTGVRKLPAAERERLRQAAVRRARQRVAAILAASGTGADQSP
jgi:lambda repressor-like predicted transcriptional regulator